MSEKLNKELSKLWTGELASVFTFVLCYFSIAKKHTILVLYPLLVLCFILLQGSFYWLICLKKITQCKNYNSNVGKIYRILKYIDLILLFAYIPILIVSSVVVIKYYVVGIFLILFGLVEFVNYFLYRLSYKNIGILFSQIKTNTLKKSRIAKEIENVNLPNT